MLIQRTITILLPYDDDLRRTLDAYRDVRQKLSAPCLNEEGFPLSALALHRAEYQNVKGSLSAQMTCSAIRSVAAAYVTASKNGSPAQKPFTFSRPFALFLIGKQNKRDAEFRKDGLLSIWTVGGRKRLSYQVPAGFRTLFERALWYDSITVIERGGKLLGRVSLTIDAPAPAGMEPVGIDLNETNALVAVNTKGQELFVSGLSVKVLNTRNRKTFQRLQKKRAARKAEQKSTRSVRRLLKQLGRRQRNRTQTFAQQAASQLVNWAAPGSVLVFEDLRVPAVSRGNKYRKGTHRRLTQWQRGLITRCSQNKAQEVGMPVEFVNPAFTSQICSCCGERGERRKHRFSCAACGFLSHADINAAVNIRNRYTALRSSEPLPVGSEARSRGQAFKGQVLKTSGVVVPLG